jgi:hypothetical protein
VWGAATGGGGATGRCLTTWWMVGALGGCAVGGAESSWKDSAAWVLESVEGGDGTDGRLRKGVVEGGEGWTWVCGRLWRAGGGAGTGATGGVGSSGSPQQQQEDVVAGVSGSVVEGLPELLGEGGWQGRKPGDGASSLG